MRESADHEEALEQRTIIAHRAYLGALIAWERTVHRMSCPICGPGALSEDERARSCEAAQAEKESRRVAFRDLCDELGFVPADPGISLPPKENTCCDALADARRDGFDAAD